MKSTGDVLSDPIYIWSSSVKDFGESYVKALDLLKVFDKSGVCLNPSLPSFSFYPLLCTLLSNRSVAVKVDGSTSISYPLKTAVPQCYIASPTLSFINDPLNNNPIHSYNDSSTPYSSSLARSLPLYFDYFP